MFASGAVFKKKFDGDVFDVAILKAHPIYKYGKPILLGLYERKNGKLFKTL